MCRTVFIRPPPQFEDGRPQQKQVTSSHYSHRPYTPYIPPNVSFPTVVYPGGFPAPPPPEEEQQEDTNAFKLPPGLQIVEPSSPLEDFTFDYDKPAAFDIADPADESSKNVDFPEQAFVEAAGVAFSPPACEESEHDMSIPARFCESDSTSGGSSPDQSGHSYSSLSRPLGKMENDDVGAYSFCSDFKSTVPPQDYEEDSNHDLEHAHEESISSMADGDVSSSSGSPTNTVSGCAPGKKRKRTRVEKWKRRDNEKHLAGERKRRANRMGKLGELKELLPITKGKVSSIKVLHAAINHFKKILSQPVPAEKVVAPRLHPKQAPMLDNSTFLEGMRGSQFLSLMEVDPNEMVTHCSPAMKDFLGIPEHDCDSFHISKIIHPQDYSTCFTGFVPLSANSYQVRFGCYLRSGHRVFVPSSVRTSSSGSKCVYTITPLPACDDGGIQPPFEVMKPITGGCAPSALWSS
mmetsp:Transcript_23079/g.46715  ORF Transcript_23079/g.46715 Transcript_23079/m.46715 type:complete len:463 (-) Transcript_23079:173-1561(-)|eukprot:CAMPEP_0181314654 /NCGR_PEP_ID=MMETSP1101-20121128/14937_1 /TAXON_ID=46948 /ORGANISM="Rhodomonas abbreviata, Strain Caron Lab Isolate" /LENGTH=462 /DNA_ID=CAMNT_0023421769 /DNA_START=139 /DNA_END=1527 /DNA_ORIENTATION=+